jgi:hypothetical protein
VLLPYIASDATGAPDDIITYTSAIEVSKAVGSYIETDASTPATGALDNAGITALFELSGDDAIDELAVAGITGLTAAAVPSGKTLRLASGTNTTIGLDLSAATAGTLIVAAGATLEVTTSITGKTGDTSNITVNGVIKLASNATALSVTNVDIAAATIDASAAGVATLTLPTGTATVKAIIVGNSNDLTIAGATGLKLSSIKSGATTKGVKSATVAKYSTSDTDYVGLATAADTFIVTKLDGNVFSIATDTSAVSIGSALTIAGDAKLKTEGTGGISVAVANLAPTSANFAKFASGSTIAYSDLVAGTAEALEIPEGITVKLAAASTLATITGLTVNGVLDLDANTGLTLAAITTGTVSTGEKGVIKSATATAATLQALLSKAGDSLAIQQTGDVTLAAATTVKAGTTLTIGASGKVTAESAGTSKALTVAGAVILDGGTLATAGTHADTADIIITGDGSITAGGIVISGAGGINTNTASGSFLGADALTLEDTTTIVITESATIQAAGADGITFKAGSYVFGAGVSKALSVADGKATLTLPNTATSLAIGDDVASELVFGAASTYKAGGVTTTLTPGATATAKDDVKLTFKAGAKIVSGTGATAVTSGAALKATGEINADNSTYTVGADTTLTKTATTSTWSGTVNAGA